MAKYQEEPEDDVLAETDNFIVWRSRETEDSTYHIELGGLTLHLDSEEWEEFVVLVKSAAKPARG